MSHPLLPKGAAMVTIRLDRDSLGAMAVLKARAQNKGADVDLKIVSWLGAVDQMGGNNAKITHNKLYRAIQEDQKAQLSIWALNVVARNHERWPDVLDKVDEFVRILTGEVSLLDLQAYEAFKVQSTTMDFSYLVEMFGDVAFLEVPKMYDAARNWANQHYPIAVIFDPKRVTRSGGLQARWSVIRQAQPKLVFDRYGFERDINRAEAMARRLGIKELTEQSLTWGGPANIITSPQGAGNGTHVKKEEILELVRRHYQSGVIT